MPDVYEKGSEEYEFVKEALGSGTLKAGEIQFLLLLANLTGTSVLTVQQHYMDAKVGMGQVFRSLQDERTL